MGKFLYEMHTHTSETSRCAHVSAHGVVDEYIHAGYSGIVITDHMSTSTFEKFDHINMTWKEKVDYFLGGYREALKAADGRINVLLGMELRFDIPNVMNDYLVYGVTEKFLYSTPELLNMNLHDFSKLAHRNKMVIFQAHPFRVGMKISKPKYLNGIEVFNGNPRHDSSNYLASIWAKKHDLLAVSGSDFHEYEDLARGGIYFEKEIETNDELVKELLFGQYELKK
ncbi:MAG: PHP domain-containing protein [Oscillospiraceae bacterium]|nr:PHP domain-containing protein [Oscillospiraceae bacterium]